MDKMLLNTCYRCFRQQALGMPRLSHAVPQIARIHTTGLRAAKGTKPKAKKLQKREPLVYKPPTRKIPPQSPIANSTTTSTSTSTSLSSPTPTQNRKTNPYLFGIHPLVGAGIAALFLGIPLGYFLYQPSSDPSSATIPITDYRLQQDVSDRYSTIAPTFDSSISTTEKTMGIAKLRKKLASQAQGDVLEVSIGTGRNLEYYDWNFGGKGVIDSKGYLHKGKVRSLTAVDISEEMLEIAHEKFSEKFPGVLGVRWVIADASQPGKIPGPPRNANERSGNKEGKYDTIVQTFGLCSVDDPVALLQSLGKCVKADEGRILLLEHGRAKYGWLNNMLDKNAEKHAMQHGCWWNRDIEDIVRKSGLEIVKIDRPKWFHAGTTWWVELKKKKEEVVVGEKSKATTATNEGERDSRKLAGQELPAAVPVKKKGWW